MDGFLLALLLVFALACGGRDQRMVAQWADTLGQSGQLLAVAVLSACVSAGVMAFVGAEFAALLPRKAAQMLVAFALAAWAAVPLTAGLGGALGGAAAVGLGWGAGSAALARLPLRAIRLALALCLGIAALFIGIDARFAAI